VTQPPIDVSRSAAAVSRGVQRPAPRARSGQRLHSTRQFQAFRRSKRRHRLQVRVDDYATARLALVCSCSVTFTVDPTGAAAPAHQRLCVGVRRVLSGTSCASARMFINAAKMRRLWSCSRCGRAPFVRVRRHLQRRAGALSVVKPAPRFGAGFHAFPTQQRPSTERRGRGVHVYLTLAGGRRPPGRRPDCRSGDTTGVRPRRPGRGPAPLHGQGFVEFL